MYNTVRLTREHSGPQLISICHVDFGVDALHRVTTVPKMAYHPSTHKASASGHYDSHQ